MSVGDSLLWVCRDGRLHRLNADHSMRPVLQDLVELGRMTEEEALADPRANQLRSVIYGDAIPLIDMNYGRLRASKRRPGGAGQRRPGDPAG